MAQLQWNPIQNTTQDNSYMSLVKSFEMDPKKLKEYMDIGASYTSPEDYYINKNTVPSNNNNNQSVPVNDIEPNNSNNSIFENKNAQLLIKHGREAGLTPLQLSTLLSAAQSESGFTPRGENLKYSKQNLIDIRDGKHKVITPKGYSTIFNALQGKTDDELGTMAGDEKAIYNAFYGSRFGYNGSQYLGGFIGHTGKNNFKELSALTGIDFVNSPYLINSPEHAARAAVAWSKKYFKGNDARQMLSRVSGSKHIGDMDKRIKQQQQWFAYLNRG